jgi:leader peptidase (prepilin peptidase)/N-methyltransferase
VLLDERDELSQAAQSPDRDAQIAETQSQLRALSIWRTRSACPACRNRIAWYDNVPVLSWLVLAGRCRNCKTRISPRYLAVELITAALFVACYIAFDATLLALKFCAFSFFLVGLIFTDAEWKLLPDALTFPGLLVGLLSSVAVPAHDLAIRALVPAARAAEVSPADPLAAHSAWRWMSLAQSMAGAIAGAAFVYGAGVLYMRMRPDLREHGHSAMGLGDVKLMAMIGSFLGVTLTAVTLFAASLGGALFGIAVVVRVWMKRMQRRHAGKIRAWRAWQSAALAFRYFQVPFGVFLGCAALMAAFYGDALLRWYAGFFV